MAVAQAQVLNKILNTGDFSIISANNLTEDYFFNYKSEFNYIKNHFEQYGSVPDALTFASKYEDFDLMQVSEPTSYLLEELFREYNQASPFAIVFRYKDLFTNTASITSRAQKKHYYQQKHQHC